MLSDVTSAPRAAHDVSADPADDFEWVNAWAASSPHTSKPAAVPQGTALVQELAHIPVKERAAEAVAVRRVAPEPIETPEAPTPLSLEPVVAPVQPVASESVAPTPPATATPEISVAVPREHDLAMVVPLESRAHDDTNDQSSAAAAPLASDAEAVVPALADDVNAPTTAPELVELIDEQPAPADERASAPISFLDFAARAKRWRNLFGIARHREPPAAEPLGPLDPLPGSSDPIATDVAAVDAPMLLELAPAIAPDQLELDIAEIEVRRDALLAEWEHERRMPAAPAARSRTTDYVPILLGCVLGFTLVVVFGAAASFVSLR